MNLQMNIMADLREQFVKRIMLLSHEMGQEMGEEEVIEKAEKLARYLRDKEHIDADMNHALLYWQEVLENRYFGEE